MKSLGFACYTLGISVAIAFLAGCAGTQQSIGTPGGIPQSRAIATHAERGGSWMVPEANSDDLLYASNFPLGELMVFSYPSGKEISDIQVPSKDPAGLCSDSAGNVFVATQGTFEQSYIYEYAHAGSTPIATLSDPGEAYSCAIDPTTGNLAVANYAVAPSDNGDVAIYKNASGNPTIYSDPKLGVYHWCTFDNRGNLYVDGTEQFIDELKKGRSRLSEILLNKSISPGSMQWARTALVFVHQGTKVGEQSVYQVKVSGDQGTVFGPIVLRTKDYKRDTGEQFWIQGSTMLVTGQTRKSLQPLLEFWHYPQGGKPTKVDRFSSGYFFGVTLSVAK